MRRILVATDGSEGADRAADAAAALAAALGINLCVFTVTDDTSSKLLKRLAREEQISIGDAVRAVPDRILSQANERADRLGVMKIHLKSSFGDSTEEILEIVCEMRADTVFVGR